MDKIEDFEFVQHRTGFQARKLFDNGYGASIIPEADGKTYELAVLRHYNGKKTHISYDSGLTTDVIRYAEVNEIHDLVELIRGLPDPEDG